MESVQEMGFNMFVVCHPRLFYEDSVTITRDVTVGCYGNSHNGGSICPGTTRYVG